MSESSDMLVMDLPVPSDPVEADITEDRRNCSDRHNQVASRSGLMNNGKDVHHAGETSGSESGPSRRKAPAVCEEDGENPELREEGVVGGGQEEGAEVVAEKQRRKRKRTVMNDEQVSIIEKALLEEPEMQKNAASLKAWAEKLGSHGSEVTTSQLKNWLNNRKARLARLAKENCQIPDAGAPSHANQSTPETTHAPDPPLNSILTVIIVIGSSIVLYSGVASKLDYDGSECYDALEGLQELEFVEIPDDGTFDEGSFFKKVKEKAVNQTAMTM